MNRWFQLLRLYFFVWLIRRVFVRVARASKRRGTHPAGVGAAGSLRIVANPTFPPHPFFVPGAEFPALVRHATLQFEDASFDIRSASLKFSNQSEESPLDLIMNTGPASAFWNIPSFLAFVKAKRAGKDALMIWSQRSPRGREAAIGGLRRAPESFSRLHYYAQLVYAFRAHDGKARYVKYRLLPETDEVESGLPSQRDLASPWEQGRWPEETRPKDYLRRELVDRLSRGPVVYRLQLQLHEASPTDDAAIFDSSEPWDEKTHPWQDLAIVTLDRALTPDETERLRFNIGHQPPSLGVLPAESPEDFNSLGFLRSRVYSASQKGRLS